MISAIKYQVLHEDKPRLYRFQSASGKLRHFLCHHARADELEDFYAALLYALHNERHVRILDVVLHLHDENGDSWIVERTADRSRIFQNRQPVQDRAEEVLRAALFDSMVSGPLNQQAPTLKRFELMEEDEQLIAFAHGEADSAPLSLREAVKGQIDLAVGKLQEFLGTRAYIDAAMAQKLADGLEPLYLMWRELNTDQRQEQEEQRKLGAVDPETIARLEEEMDLLDRLRLKSAPLLDPARSPQVLKEKLQETENKLQNICRKNDIPQLPANLADIPWEKVLQLLARLKAYEQLQVAYDRSVGEMENRVAPLFDDYLATIEHLLQHDTQITAELQCCLTTLTSQIKKAAEPETPASKWGQWLDKYRKTLTPTPQQPAITKALVPQAATKDERLDNARMAVDYALARLGELHSNLQNAEGMNQDARTAIRDFHEKIVLEHGKLRKNWELVAEKYGLAKDCNLKTLLGLIQHYAQIAELWQKAEEIKRELRQYRQELDDVGSIILEWRHVTGSQKETPLDNATILLGELRGILDYQEQKQAQLKRYREQDVRLQANHHIQQSIKRRCTELQTSWRQTFERLALPMRDIQNLQWPECFVLCHRITGLHSLAREALKAARNDRIFAPEQLTSPLSVFFWRKEVSYGRTKTLLTNLLEKAAPNQTGLFLIADPVLADHLAKAGLCASAPVSAAQRKKPDAPTPTKGKSAPILSDRAQAALKVFQATHRKSEMPD